MKRNSKKINYDYYPTTTTTTRGNDSVAVTPPSLSP
jgi:hypothetical protein